jgi:hypothetical protein
MFVASGLLCAGEGYAALRKGPADSNGAVVGIPVSTFGSDGTALQRAIDTGRSDIVVDTTILVSRDVRLRSNQRLHFAGGRLLVAPDAQINEAVLDCRKATGIEMSNPVIDASLRRDGVTGIQLFDSTSVRISGGRLVQARLAIGSYDARIARGIEVTDLVLDMRGYRSTAIYLSGVRGVSLRGVQCTGGREGIGIYNNARAIRLSNVTSYRHQQDGFVVIAGQDIRYEGCRAHGNGQSGFTTQRQSGGEDSRFVSWSDCQAWQNDYDGFDIRGATDDPWGVDTGFALQGCRAWANKATGFYIVRAEGTMLRSCTAVRNRQQNLFIERSDGVVVDGFRAVSGAADVTPGPNKAGILIYDSVGVQVRSAVSSNEEGQTQEFGLSFTGSSRGGRVIGGDFSDNAKPPVVPAENMLVPG